MSGVTTEPPVPSAGTTPEAELGAAGEPATPGSATIDAATIDTVRSTSRAPETSRPSPCPGGSERNWVTA